LRRPWEASTYQHQRFGLVRLYDLRVVDIVTERRVDGLHVHAQPVGADLHAVAEARGDVRDERVGVLRVALADEEARDELGLRVDRNVGPRVADAACLVGDTWRCWIMSEV
jgi:hypothetical protein